MAYLGTQHESQREAKEPLVQGPRRLRWQEQRDSHRHRDTLIPRSERCIWVPMSSCTSPLAASQCLISVCTFPVDGMNILLIRLRFPALFCPLERWMAWASYSFRSLHTFFGLVFGLADDCGKTAEGRQAAKVLRPTAFLPDFLGLSHLFRSLSTILPQFSCSFSAVFPQSSGSFDMGPQFCRSFPGVFLQPCHKPGLKNMFLRCPESEAPAHSIKSPQFPVFL